ncbi:MAG: lipoyl(octanoyl) transferase [Sulfurimonas sp.]|nr:MAG: lipoyl(octanoyl) transferase [Sulfurimonas sp.]
MIVHNWGLINYEHAHNKMLEIHKNALSDKQNHLILCQHPEIYTLGYDEEDIFDVKSLKTDRGGSISSHSEGQNIYYFCFHSPYPARFLANIISVYTSFFKQYLADVYYDKKKPGFYIGSKKLLSLGFRYKQGVSLHGVSLNVDINLDFHNKIKPCNLKGFSSSSLVEQGLNLSCKDVDTLIIQNICEAFNESV